MSIVGKSPPKVVFFDFGKTLHDFDLDLFFNWLSQTCSISRHYLWDTFSSFPDGLLYKYECGEATQQFIVRVRDALQKLCITQRLEGKEVLVKDFTDDEFIKNWNDIFDTKPFAEDRLQLMRGLKENGCKLYILSNINEAQFAYVRNDPRFKEIFWLTERFIASCDSDIQCRKTRFHAYTLAGNNWYEASKIFYKALGLAKVLPEQAVYIDDILDYVEVFRRMGGQGIHHTGPWTKVEAELYKLGLRWE